MTTVESTSKLCQVCLRPSDPYDNPALKCQGICQRLMHIKCLKRGALPTSFIGDVFYDLHCETCSGLNDEIIARQKLPWLTTVILTLYNLREKSSGISRRGYFHWKSDISTFINTNWELLFPKSVKKKKNWIGTISGTLSHYSGIFFQSGTSELGDQGWWKLINNDPPEALVNQYYKLLEQKKQNQARLKSKNIGSPKSESNISHEDENSISIEQAKPRETRQIIEIKKTESYTKPPKSITSFGDFSDILDLDIDVPNIEDDFPSFNATPNSIMEALPFPDFNDNSTSFMSELPTEKAQICDDDSAEDVNVSDVSMMDDFPEQNEASKMQCNDDDETETSKNDYPFTPVPSLFNQSVPRPWPWDETIKFNQDEVKPMMTEREEEFLLQKIEQYKHLLDSAPPFVRRLYRKLAVRKVKRQYGLPILNVDTFGKDLQQKSQFKKKGNIVLDRFISEDTSIFFEQRLQGHCQPTSVHSPYTNRLLKPFIRRDTSSRPLWLRVTNELLSKVNRNDPKWKAQASAPIDYSYIRPQHIPAVNSLCTQFFWPGVDLTECLQYPDFTCVVLYKKLVIGFAVMVPDVGYNEAYISFFLVRPEWRKAGIGTFMLYHLIQTCMGKDITLHVSATNPALILYQKFGFKQEEFVQDFYDKYILPSTRESKHALFLRLSR